MSPLLKRVLFYGAAIFVVGALLYIASPPDCGVRMASHEKAIYNNLRQIAAGGQQYMLETGAASVSYQQLVGDYFMPMYPISGERYDELIVVEDGGTLNVHSTDGLDITFPYDSVMPLRPSDK